MSKQNNRGRRRQIAVAAALAVGTLIALPAHAVRFQTDGGIDVDFSSTISYGFQVRTEKPATNNIGNDNGGNVPTSGDIGQRTAGNAAFANPDFNFINGDDGNLNYKRGDVVSAALKGTHELGMKWGDGYKFLGRTSWVYDSQVDRTRALPLSADAKDLAAHNLTLLDLWLSKDTKLINEQPATIKFGNQVVSWGEDVFIPGGVNTINALDLRKYHTPGTQLKEVFRPAPMLYLNAGLAESLNVEAYYQFRWNGFQFDPVGTFFSGADIVGKGQRPAYIPSSSLGLTPGTVGDRGAMISPGTNVVPFEADRTPSNSGQFGLALRGKPKGSETEYALYYIRYHDKLPFTTLFTDPALASANVASLGYANEYGSDKDLFGASFNTKLGSWAVGGEVSYRPRDSVAIDPSVPQTGAYSVFDGTPGPTKTVDPLTGRTTVRGFVNERKFQAQMNGFYFFEVDTPAGKLMRALGAAEGYVLAEAAMTYYPNLNAGAIPYIVFPSYVVPDKFSAGYVLEIGLTYPDLFDSGINVTPQFDFSHDVKGTTPNALPFVQGRKSVFLGVNFDRKGEWRGQVGYSMFWGGGLSNPMRDRDFFGANISRSF